MLLQCMEETDAQFINGVRGQLDSSFIDVGRCQLTHLIGIHEYKLVTCKLVVLEGSWFLNYE